MVDRSKPTSNDEREKRLITDQLCVQPAVVFWLIVTHLPNQTNKHAEFLNVNVV